MTSSMRLVLSLPVLLACGGPATAESPPPARQEATGGASASGPDRGPEPVMVEASARHLTIVAAPDRLESDLLLDAGRHPAETLTFFGIESGMRVGDLFCGGGYTTELIARAVGAEGHVYCQNNAYVMDRFAREPTAARLARPGLEHAELVERELDSPLPDDATELDAVVFVLAYHDAFWMGTDRAAMNRAVFDALRPGGVYGIVDHRAEAGSGERDVQTLHRVDEATVVAEIEAAGFVLEARALNLENPDDPRDWNAQPSRAGERRGTSDRFMLRFVKPR